MSPAKKAAKNAAKKSAKHHHANDLRRAYEHLGRVEILQQTVDQDVLPVIRKLILLAQRELKNGHMKDAADLLRAAEHLSFAVSSSESAQDIGVDSHLEKAITDELEHLLHKAEQHWEEENERHDFVTTLYKRSRKRTTKALKQGSLRQALEFARAAEALAHVKKHRSEEPLNGKRVLRLASTR